MNLVQLAGSLPRDPEFREWVAEWASDVTPGFRIDVSADEAAEFIRTMCRVTSRRELATDTEAAQRFHNLIRKPYTVWRESQQQPA